MTTPATPSLTTTGKRKYAKADRLPFVIDGETFTLRRPKQTILAAAANALDNPNPDNPKRLLQLLSFTQQLISYVDESPQTDDGRPHGRDLLEMRLSDPDDALDLEDMVPLLSQMLQGWFGRPTGSPRASTPSRPRKASGGRVSRARTR